MSSSTSGAAKKPHETVRSDAIGLDMLKFGNEAIEVRHANFGWLIPPVSNLLISVAGFELAGLLPQHHELLVGVSIASQGVGFLPTGDLAGGLCQYPKGCRQSKAFHAFALGHG